MSRSQYAVELCALLVEETYGELTSRIFALLLRKGRLPIPLLSKYTRLTPRQIRAGLVVLLKQNLVYHCPDGDTGSTIYEANEDAAYSLIRSGKIMEAVGSRYGSVAKDIVRLLLESGHVTVGNLEKLYAKERSKSNEEIQQANKEHPNGGTNGIANGDTHGATNGITNGMTNGLKHGLNGTVKAPVNYEQGVLHREVARLLEIGILERVREHMFLSPSDTYIKTEKEVLQQHFGGSTKGIKQKDELKAKIQHRLQSLRSEGQDWHLSGKHNSQNGGPTKRRRLSNDVVGVNSDCYPIDDGRRLDANLVIRINHDKCTVLLRNQRLVVFARECIGETTSVVFDYALRLLEGKIQRCRPDHNLDNPDDIVEGPTFTTTELTRALPPGFDARLGIGKGELDVKASGAKGRHDEAGVAEGPGSDDDDDDQISSSRRGLQGLEASDANMDDHDPFEEDVVARPAKRQKVTFEEKLPRPQKDQSRGNTGDQTMHVRNHLMLLTADNHKFVRKCGTTGAGQWTIDFADMVEHLKTSVIDSMILDNFGEQGHRLARILRKMGKMEEKVLPTLALMKQKDIRTKLAEMQMAGIVDIQEIPRDASRAIPRLILCWFFDADRVAKMFLEGLFKKISRVFQRIDTERRKYTDVLSITERSDVRDDPPEDYLVPDQLAELREWKGKEEKLLTQVHRLEDLVGIFRDY